MKGHIMATKTSNKAKLTKKPTVKKKTTHSSICADEKYIGSEPMWDYDRAMEMSTEDFDSAMRRSLNWYNYFHNQKELKPLVIKWLEGTNHIPAERISAYKRTPDTNTPMTVCGLIKAHSIGMPLREHNKDYILRKISEVIEISSSNPIEDEAPKDSVSTLPKKTIQDYLNDKVSAVAGEIDGQIDLVFTNKTPDQKVYDINFAGSLPQASLGKLSAYITQYQDELTLAESGECEQTIESYSFLTKKDFKRIQTYLESIQADIKAYGNLKKTLKKARVKKPVNKEKLVARLKYLKEYKQLKLTSIQPIAILGMQELWVYNVRTRKLGVYYADAHSSLNIKGSTITGFSETRSVCKTLRKPESQLKEFFAAGKVAMRTFMKDIKAVETTLTGRTNADTILLKTG